MWLNYNINLFTIINETIVDKHLNEYLLGKNEFQFLIPKKGHFRIAKHGILVPPPMHK